MLTQKIVIVGFDLGGIAHDVILQEGMRGRLTDERRVPCTAV
jgi:hypothetical protein